MQAPADGRLNQDKISPVYTCDRNSLNGLVPRCWPAIGS